MKFYDVISNYPLCVLIHILAMLLVYKLITMFHVINYIVLLLLLCDMILLFVAYMDICIHPACIFEIYVILLSLSIN